MQALASPCPPHENALVTSAAHTIKSVKEIMEFSSDSAPDAKIAPAIVAGGIFVGKAVAGAAVAWGTTRALDKAFPAKK
jgi:hypothetical protein